MDLSRIKDCMRRAERGAHLTLGFLGGSITEGSLSSSPETCYAYLVYQWWRETFPRAEFSYVNGGIGGTTSHYGAVRAVTDVLMYQPDFVLVDFSVNDEPDPFFQETYEGVVRKILGWSSAPALLLLNNVYYDSGKNAQAYHNAVGDHYQVPHVSIKNTLYLDMMRGKYKREELTEDGLHPNDRGHMLVAGQITGVLEQIRALEPEAGRDVLMPAPVQKVGGDTLVSAPEKDTVLQAAEEDFSLSAHKGKAALSVPQTDTVLPAPMTANAYENAKRLTIREISPRLSGFLADPREKMGHSDHFKNGWIGREAGDSILFEVEAACIAVQYRKSVRHPALSAVLVLNGDREHPVLLNGEFAEDWGDCQYLEPVLHHGERKRHRVEITVLDQKKSQGAVPFYLMGLIIA